MMVGGLLSFWEGIYLFRGYVELQVGDCWKSVPGKIIACLIIGVKSSLPVYSVYSKVNNFMGMACQMVRGKVYIWRFPKMVVPNNHGFSY